MRITSLDDLSKLGPHAKKQIEAELNKQRPPRIKKGSNKNNQKRHTASTKNQLARTNTASPQKKPAKVMETEDGLKYCPYPNPDPSVALHIALLREFGSWWSGGELVDEMIIPNHDVRFRYDFCFPRYRLAIEFDGFGYHRDLNSFKKDREKQKHALKNGWIVHRLTNSDLRSAFDAIIPDIKIIMNHREKRDIELVTVGKVWCAIIS